uniref:carbohydrate ABC transporter permease n=1 Tax=Eisenbergiella tayi TaxID=1432052 RepID=UPI003FD7554C
MGTLQFKKKVLLFVVPAVVLYLMFSIYPFLQTLYYSFTNWDGFTTPVVIGFENFRKILNDEVYRTAVIRIFIWAILSITFKVGIALVIAYILRKGSKGVSFFRTVVFLPYVISSSAMCLMFTIMYDKEIGLLNMVLRAIGLDSLTRYWLVDEKTI